MASHAHSQTGKSSHKQEKEREKEILSLVMSWPVQGLLNWSPGSNPAEPADETAFSVAGPIYPSARRCIICLDDDDDDTIEPLGCECRGNMGMHEHCKLEALRHENRVRPDVLKNPSPGDTVSKQCQTCRKHVAYQATFEESWSVVRRRVLFLITWIAATIPAALSEQFIALWFLGQHHQVSSRIAISALLRTSPYVILTWAAHGKPMSSAYVFAKDCLAAFLLFAVEAHFFPAGQDISLLHSVACYVAWHLGRFALAYPVYIFYETLHWLEKAIDRNRRVKWVAVKLD